MNQKIVKFAQRLGYDGAEFHGKWEIYEVYAPTAKEEEPANIGKPEFIFALDPIIRLATEDEVFAYLDSLPDDDGEPMKKTVAKTFAEVMAGVPDRTISKADPDRFDRIEEVEKSGQFDQIEEIEKFNPYHDERGRFSSANGSASFTYAPGKSKAHDMAIARGLAKDRVAKAKEAEPKLTAMMQGCAEAAGGEMVGLEYAVKGEDSLTRKVHTETLEKGCTAAQAAASMKDVNRYTMQLSEDNFVSGYEKTVNALKAQGYEVVRVKNTLANPNASYRGVNTNVKSPDGSIWELQFHTAKSLEVKEVNHKLYETQRLDKTPAAKKAELGRQMAQNAVSIPTPPGIEKIGSIDKL